MTVEPQISLPALLRHARYTYGAVMRAALEREGYGDIPANGLYVLGGLALHATEVSLGQLIRDLRLSKQAAGQLIDALVVRGYLERVGDLQDRRKLTISLTERGRAAAAVQKAARQRVDASLIDRVGQTDFDRTCVTLAALVELTDHELESPDRLD